VAKLCEREADVNAPEKENGRTPLYIASVYGHKEVVAELCKRRANLEAAMTDGRTPLYIAAWKGHKEVVAELCKRGADVNAPEKENGRTPLYIASVYGHRLKLLQNCVNGGLMLMLQKKVVQPHCA